jgi:hypothetical protein
MNKSLSTPIPSLLLYSVDIVLIITITIKVRITDLNHKEALAVAPDTSIKILSLFILVTQ